MPHGVTSYRKLVARVQGLPAVGPTTSVPLSLVFTGMLPHMLTKLGDTRVRQDTRIIRAANLVVTLPIHRDNTWGCMLRLLFATSTRLHGMVVIMVVIGVMDLLDLFKIWRQVGPRAVTILVTATFGGGHGLPISVRENGDGEVVENSSSEIG